MRSPEQINKDIDNLQKTAALLFGMFVVAAVAFSITFGCLYASIQKNSPERELQANAQTTNA